MPDFVRIYWPVILPCRSEILTQIYANRCIRSWVDYFWIFLFLSKSELKAIDFHCKILNITNTSSVVKRNKATYITGSNRYQLWYTQALSQHQTQISRTKCQIFTYPNPKTHYGGKLHWGPYQTLNTETRKNKDVSISASQ